MTDFETREYVRVTPEVSRYNFLNKTVVYNFSGECAFRGDEWEAYRWLLKKVPSAKRNRLKILDAETGVFVLADEWFNVRRFNIIKNKLIDTALIVTNPNSTAESIQSAVENAAKSIYLQS